MQKSLSPGILIAMPQLGDPNFHRSVVLMLEHGDDGAMGLVLNRPGPHSLKKLAAGQKVRLDPRWQDDAVYAGGPVEPFRGFVVHDAPDIAERHAVVPGLYVSFTSESLQPLFERPHGRMRFCLGYSGWGPAQLERELAEGAWLFSEVTPSAALTNSPQTLWEDALRAMGVEPGMLVAGRGIH